MILLLLSQLSQEHSVTRNNMTIRIIIFMIMNNNNNDTPIITEDWISTSALHALPDDAVQKRAAQVAERG